MKIDCAHDAMVDVTALVENPRNANKHPDKQINLLAKIIKHQGQRAPIVVSNRSGFITKGHGRLMAIKKLGWDKVAVDYQDYSNEADEFADMIADNKIAELAEHDNAIMFEGLNEIDLTSLPSLDLLGIEDFKMPDFAPGDESDQGQLDQKKLQFYKCPNCEEKFELGQATKIAD